jgi:hypothetical protein
MKTKSRAIPGLAISLALALLPAWQTPANATEPAQDENLAYAIGEQPFRRIQS